MGGKEKRERPARKSLLSRANRPMFPLSLPASVVVDLDGAVAMLDLDRDGGRSCYRHGRFATAPSLCVRLLLATRYSVVAASNLPNWDGWIARLGLSLSQNRCMS